MEIDLRSDTLTKPSLAMRDAMFSAIVGDDVYEEDPSVNALQKKVADLFGMEAALFCPSGTMTNQIALKVLTQPQDEVICYKNAHIYKYEGGGTFSNSGVSVRLLAGERGKITVEEIQKNINPNDVHYPRTRVVALENTVNRGGGSIYTLEEIKAIAELCKAEGLKLHLDGARVMNALVETGEDPREYGQYFDTISFCLSKGLGCPVGSLIIANEGDICYARRIRKAFGGGMRQAGYLAAAGIYALENNIEGLKEDHRRAKRIGDYLERQDFVEEVYPVETNIVIFKFKDPSLLPEWQEHCRRYKVKVGMIGAEHVRVVTHLGIDDEMMKRFLVVIGNFMNRA